MSSRLVACLSASGTTAEVARGRSPQRMHVLASGARVLASGLLAGRPLRDELAVWTDKTLEV